MSNHIRMSEAWKRIQEDEATIPSVTPSPVAPTQNTDMVTLSLTRNELALIKSLVNTAVNEMSSDPNSGMNGVPAEISGVINKLEGMH